MVKEYATAIRAILSVLLAIGLVVGGCSYGKKDGEAERVALASQVSSLQEANDRFSEIQAIKNREIEKAQEAAAKWEKLANKTAKEAEEARAAKAKADKERQKALSEARRDPTCAELLERNVCDVVPLP